MQSQAYLQWGVNELLTFARRSEFSGKPRGRRRSSEKVVFSSTDRPAARVKRIVVSLGFGTPNTPTPTDPLFPRRIWGGGGGGPSLHAVRFKWRVRRDRIEPDSPTAVCRWIKFEYTRASVCFDRWLVSSFDFLTRARDDRQLGGACPAPARPDLPWERGCPLAAAMGRDAHALDDPRVPLQSV